MPRPGTKPTEDEMYQEGFEIQDDISFAAFATEADKQYSEWYEGYPAWCQEHKGYVPLRIHNLGPDNIYIGTPYELPPGPPCCWPENLGAVPPDLPQWQIAMINDCVPQEAIMIVAATLNAAKDAFRTLTQKT